MGVSDGGDRDRYTLRGGSDHDPAEVVQAAYQPTGADHELLAVVLDVAAAGVGIGFFERAYHLRHRNAGGLQALRIEHDLVLFVLAAEAVHLDDAGHGAQHGGNLPVEYLFQLHERELLAMHHELEDFPEPRADRSQLRPAILRGHRFGCFPHAFANQLARKIDVRAVLEHHRYDG